MVIRCSIFVPCSLFLDPCSLFNIRSLFLVPCSLFLVPCSTFLLRCTLFLRMPEQLFSYQHLFEFTKNILQKIGCSASDADLATRVLLSADVRGIDSHGVARLSGYVRLWEAKR